MTYSDDITPANDALATEVINRTWKVTDACDNYTEKTQTITVNPQVRMNTPADQTVCHDSTIAAVVFGTTITDGTMSYSWERDNTTNVTGIDANGTGNINAAALKNATTTVRTTTFTVTPTYTNNGVSCEGEPVTFTITVNPEVLLSVTNDHQSKTFGEAIDDVVVSYSEHAELTYTTLPDGLSYSASTKTLSGTPTSVGNYTVTFTATSTQTPNCGSKTAVVNIEVTPAELSITLDTAKTYDGTDFVSTYAATGAGYTVMGLVEGDAVTAGAVTTTGNKNAGTYTGTGLASETSLITTPFATTKGISNYNVTYDFTQKITKRIVHIATADSSRLYDGTPLVQPRYTITGDGFVDGEVTNIHTTGSVTAISTCVDNTIEYTPMAAFLASNYTIDTTLGQLCVTGSLAPITVTSASAPAPITYDGQTYGDDEYRTYTVTYDGVTIPANDATGLTFTLPTGDVLTVTPTFTGVTNVRDANDTLHNNVFTYSITNAEAYLGSKTVEFGTVNIAPRPITIAIDTTKTYDGTPFVVTYNQLHVSNLVAGESLSAGTVASDGFTVGEYTCTDGAFNYMMALTASQNGFNITPDKFNYTPTFDITLRITARPLTITALSDTKVYDGTALTASYELSSTADPILGEGDAVQAETVGSQTCVGTSANTVAEGYKVMHTSIVDGVTATEDVTSSYDISTVNGTLTVTPITTGFDCPASLPITLNEGTADTTLTATQLGTPTLNGSALPDYVTASSDLAAQNPLAEGTHTITWTLRDNCGNAMTTCTQTVEVSYQPCEGTITMANGTYHYKRIGHQCWFTENLREETGEHHAYKDNVANVADYGYLYSWYTTVGVTEGDDNAEPDNTTVGADGQHYVQGICPDGWSVGSANDYTTLNAAVPVNLLKDPSTQYWLNGYEGTPGGSGFNARGSGWFNSALNRYEDFKTGFHFWNSDSTPGSSTASAGTVNYYCDSIATETASKRDLRSVRCVRKVNP